MTGKGYSISGSNFGSASILPISWMYIAMMGQNSPEKGNTSCNFKYKLYR